MLMAIRKWWVHFSVGAWFVACGSVLWLLWSYSNAAGPQGMLPVGWTPDARLECPEDRPMLLVFAHPKCPCTRATMSAIERLQRDVPGTFATRVVFYEPDGADASWHQTDLWVRAQKLIDAKAIADPGGSISGGAGAAVSGCVALLDPQDGLLFWGGVTPSRGHEGESVGLNSLRSILRGQEPVESRAPVFGCELVGPGHGVIEMCGGGGSDASHDF